MARICIFYSVVSRLYTSIVLTHTSYCKEYREIYIQTYFCNKRVTCM